eukprot:gnl/TRDRNA2_/TRDRNA2_35355_c0_seq1.p1 gnl/TRDRNA2_/TRDRNA2_35355_c0~~gnl/TRDRNA2_/TRDRNA2_35355_c0_seq1.p1  ORF type:complete len:374 (-),score=30.08 gnl/TRDRNA2_/TRDRNA2_35355_c0_seq1:65-1186(-)
MSSEGGSVAERADRLNGSMLSGHEAVGPDLQLRPLATNRSGRAGFVLAHVAMISVGCTFGFWNVLADSVLNEPCTIRGVAEQPCTSIALTLGFIRALGATPLLFALSSQLEKVPLPQDLPWRDRAQLAALGVTNGIGDAGVFLVGLQLTSPTVAAFFQPVTPVVCCTFAVILGLERISLRKVAGVCLGVAGACCMLDFKNASDAHNQLLGDLVLAVGICFGAAVVLQQKPLYVRYGPGTITAYSFAVSASLFALICAALYPGAEYWAWITASGYNAFAIAYAVIICSFCNYYLMCFANRHLDATVITMYAPVQPVVTVLIQWLHKGNVPSIMDALTLLLTGLGLYLVTTGGAVADVCDPDARSISTDQRLLRA